MLEPEIRPIAPADRHVWQDLWRQYLAFYGTERPDEVYDTTFARLTSGRPGEFQGCLAWVDGKAAGLVHFLFHRTCWSVADTCYLQDLFVVPDARGGGTGRALIEHVYAAADTAGAAQVYWLTQDFNATARRLYDRVGVLTPFVRYNRA